MPFEDVESVIELVRQDVEQVLTADPEDPRRRCFLLRAFAAEPLGCFQTPLVWFSGAIPARPTGDFSARAFLLCRTKISSRFMA